jgi:hypothetical protein
MRRADHHLFWADKPYREDHSILVAGCGTSQAAKHALRWPQLRLPASISAHQLAIEQINQLGMSLSRLSALELSTISRVPMLGWQLSAVC